MKGLVTGIFLGVGIGFLLAPMRGEEMRHLVRERWQELRGNELVKQVLPTIPGDSSQTRDGLSHLAQFALNSMKANDATLTGLAQLAIDKMVNYQVSLHDLANLASTVMKKAG